MERLGEGVDRELDRLGPAGRIGQLVEAWPAAVGDSISRNAWPARVGRDGTLHVATSSSTWAFELGQLSPTILERLRSALGSAAPPALRFAPGPLPEPAVASPAGRPPGGLAQPTEQHRRAAAALAAAVGDDDLRALVARAAAASLARASSSPDQRTAPTGASATLPPPAIG